ncbi:MAG: hypothetical protein U0228_10045 [Myxococcaceae bacterium]
MWIRAVALTTLVCALPAHAADDPDPWLGPDKALHFSLSVGLATVGYASSMFVTDDARIRVALGAGFALLAGAGKELLDLAGLGHPSWRDFAWDCAGTLVGVVLSVLVDQLLVAPAAGLPVW